MARDLLRDDELPRSRLFALADILGLTVTVTDGILDIEDGHSIEIEPGLSLTLPCEVLGQFLTSTSVCALLRIKGDLGAFVIVRPDTLRFVVLDLSKADAERLMRTATLDAGCTGRKIEALLRKCHVTAYERERAAMAAWFESP